MISVLLSIALLGFIVWIITLIPMPAPFHQVIIAVACLIAVLYALGALGYHVPGGRLN